MPVSFITIIFVEVVVLVTFCGARSSGYSGEGLTVLPGLDYRLLRVYV